MKDCSLILEYCIAAIEQAEGKLFDAAVALNHLLQFRAVSEVQNENIKRQVLKSGIKRAEESAITPRAAKPGIGFLPSRPQARRSTATAITD